MAALSAECDVTWPTPSSTPNSKHITTTVHSWAHHHVVRQSHVSPVGASQSTQQFEGGYPGGEDCADPCYDHLRPGISQAQRMLSQSSQAFCCICHCYNTPSPFICKGPLSTMSSKHLDRYYCCSCHHRRYWHWYLHHCVVMSFGCLDATDELA